MSCVLITGAASGLGWALAQACFARGDNLLLTDINEPMLRERAQTLNAPERIATLAGDICEPAHHRALLETAAARFGGVGVLVNNAGITHRSLTQKTDPEVLWRVMRVNWQAPLALTLAALPQLQQQRGSIVNIGSMAGWMPVLGRSAYCAAKSALAQSFEVLRGEQLQHGIHVLMAYPGFLATPIEQNALGFDGGPARHARSSVGKPRSAEWMAARIVRALERRQKRVYSDRLAMIGSLLWRRRPDLYQRIMMKKFAVELQQ
ncbi:MAG: SDR family NAD(P)-dependent oxidoreductase [Ectothiorhodospiraceae bacterium]|nr:SDR family NAD(P)-dependent oxidoreductase [Ectothiorhodospiraceae bacterium]